MDNFFGDSQGEEERNDRYISSFVNNAVRSGRAITTETITFKEYFKRCIENPSITQTSGERIYEMIMSEGTTYDEERDVLKYNFFHNKIFGADQAIERIMEYFKAANMGMDIRKRVLLLLGPPGGGKSLFLQTIKDGLREYTKTDRGELYRVRGCPMNEDPMNLIEDQSVRDKIYKDYKIKITGRPCPHCKQLLESDWYKNLSEEVKVERFYIDEEKRQGIGTFAPSVNNDMTELYGDVDARRIEELGDASDARSFSFSGELHKANRGIMEFIEILKAEDDLLHVLLSLAEEEEFKMPRFPLVSVDETLIAHTNEEEFLKFISKKENEAIVDRLFIVAMPYNMDPRDEELIYHSAVQDIIKGTGKTIHPGAIRFASEYVIFTRMPDYNEEDEFGDFLEMREGMFGLSPRFILNTIGLAITRELDDDILTPDDMFESLERMIKEYRVLTDETRSMYLKILEELYKRKRDAYFDMTINDVDRRFLDDFGLGGRRITG